MQAADAAVHHMLYLVAPELVDQLGIEVVGDVLQLLRQLREGESGERGATVAYQGEDQLVAGMRMPTSLRPL